MFIGFIYPRRDSALLCANCHRELHYNEKIKKRGSNV